MKTKFWFLIVTYWDVRNNLYHKLFVLTVIKKFKKNYILRYFNRDITVILYIMCYCNDCEDDYSTALSRTLQQQEKHLLLCDCAELKRQRFVYQCTLIALMRVPFKNSCESRSQNKSLPRCRRVLCYVHSTGNFDTG
jgi:hypothetical protein